MRVLVLLFFCSCAHQVSFNADIWQHEQLPQEVCDRAPELKLRGVFRVVTREGKRYLQRIPYCHPAIKKYLGVHRSELVPFLRDVTRPTF